MTTTQGDFLFYIPAYLFHSKITSQSISLAFASMVVHLRGPLQVLTLQRCNGRLDSALYIILQGDKLTVNSVMRLVDFLVVRGFSLSPLR